MPEPEGIAKALREPLLKTFPAALLGRLVVDPVLPAQRRDDRQHRPAAARAHREARRARRTGVPFTYDDEVVKLIVSRCTELESGGRMIDAILTNTLLPRISREILVRLGEGRPVTQGDGLGAGRGLRVRVRVSVGAPARLIAGARGRPRAVGREPGVGARRFADGGAQRAVRLYRDLLHHGGQAARAPLRDRARAMGPVARGCRGARGLSPGSPASGERERGWRPGRVLPDWNSGARRLVLHHVRGALSGSVRRDVLRRDRGTLADVGRGDAGSHVRPGHAPVPRAHRIPGGIRRRPPQAPGR